MILSSVFEWFDQATGRFNWKGNPATGAALVEIVGGSAGSVGDASAVKQDAQTALLTQIANATQPDKETPYITFRCNTAFTGASIGNIIAGILTIDTVSNTLVNNTPLWYNFSTGAPLIVSDVSKLTAIAASSLTAAELGAMTLAISAAGLPLPTGASTEATLLAIKALLPTSLKGDRLIVDGNVQTASAITTVSGSASSVQLLALNSGRMGIIVVNDSTATLYLKFGTVATTSSYTYKLLAGDTLEISHIAYGGRIDGIWSAANGFAMITELS